MLAEPLWLLQHLHWVAAGPVLVWSITIRSLLLAPYLVASAERWAELVLT
jgi:hypothetical protein